MYLIIKQLVNYEWILYLSLILNHDIRPKTNINISPIMFGSKQHNGDLQNTSAYLIKKLDIPPQSSLQLSFVAPQV